MNNDNAVNSLIRQAYRPKFEDLIKDHPGKKLLLEQWDNGTLDIDKAMAEIERLGWENIRKGAAELEVNKDGYVTFQIKKD